MGSRYDLCPKCGAVTKDGKCTSCGRLLIGKSSNSTMDKWRQESRSWQNYNRSAHQDHCTDHGGDGNVYLNGKVIRKTSNYRSFDYAQEASYKPDNGFEEDDILSYSSEGRSGVSDYSGQSSASGYSSAQSSASVFTANPAATDTGNQTAQPAGKVAPRKKKRKLALVIWLIFIVYVIVAEFMEENDMDLDDFGQYIEDVIDDVKYDSEAGNSDFDNYVYVDEAATEDATPPNYSGDIKDLVVSDYLHGAWVEDTPMSAKEYTYNQDYYEFCDYIQEDAGYDIYIGKYYYCNIDKGYDIEYGDLGYPSNVEIWSRYPVIRNSGLSNEDELNRIIYDRMSDCTEVYYRLEATEEGEQYGLYSWAYITYMDEDILSIAFYDYYYTSADLIAESPTYNDYGSRVSAITIDMKKGEIINLENMIDFPDDFTEQFMKTYEEQSGSKLDFLTPKEIREMIDAGYVFAFYTPVGIEVGVGWHDYGSWASCSYKSMQEISGQ